MKRPSSVHSQAATSPTSSGSPIAGLFESMNHVDVKIVTLVEGEVSHLHVGLKGSSTSCLRNQGQFKPPGKGVAAKKESVSPP